MVYISYKNCSPVYKWYFKQDSNWTTIIRNEHGFPKMLETVRSGLQNHFDNLKPFKNHCHTWIWVEFGLVQVVEFWSIVGPHYNCRNILEILILSNLKIIYGILKPTFTRFNVVELVQNNFNISLKHMSLSCQRWVFIDA